jgi:hypothetical protein
MIQSKINKFEGIIIEFKVSDQYSSYYHKVVAFCTYNPHNSSHVGTLVEISVHNIKRREE